MHESMAFIIVRRADYIIAWAIPIIILLANIDLEIFSTATISPYGYRRIPNGVPDMPNLISHIQPNRRLRYWQYEDWIGDSMTIGSYGGDSTLKNRIRSDDVKEGFFSSVHIPDYYSKVSIIQNEQPEYITSKAEMIDFIGHVDNLEEALLIACLKGYFVDHSDWRGGSYLRTSEGYELYLGKGLSCPVTHRSIKIKIKLNGGFSVRDKGIYYQSSDCIDY